MKRFLILENPNLEQITEKLHFATFDSITLFITQNRIFNITN